MPNYQQSHSHHPHSQPFVQVSPVYYQSAPAPMVVVRPTFFAPPPPPPARPVAYVELQSQPRVEPIQCCVIL